jgi:hypothetical protein
MFFQNVVLFLNYTALPRRTTLHAGFFLGLHFGPEGGGSMLGCRKLQGVTIQKTNLFIFIEIHTVCYGLNLL